VIVIIGILVTLAIPRYGALRAKARNTQVRSGLADIQKALENFQVDHNGQYPFRIRYYADAGLAGFDPRETDVFVPVHSEHIPPPVIFSLGLIGGVETVDSSLNVQPRKPGWQPSDFGFDDQAFRRIFNQYSDPLVAMGYMSGYPTNPFLKRPMGAIPWGYGGVPTNPISGSGGNDTNPGQIDKTIPFEDLSPTPGDFVYTFFYRVEGQGGNAQVVAPRGIVPCADSYELKGVPAAPGSLYFVDTVDSYQLWAYGDMPLNGGTFTCYPNRGGVWQSKTRKEAFRDWDGSGTKDMYEIGLCAYFKSTGSGTQSLDAGGKKLEF
jgi:type II secretory pathway pseudopilin PulG